MSTPRQILAAIFDMDGLLIDSEPLWDRAELDVMASLGVDISHNACRHAVRLCNGARPAGAENSRPWAG